MATIPASIRYKNPGAMWGGNAISKKWGETGNVSLNDGLGQGNRIAVFPTFVQGACAQFDLWRTPRYRNLPFAQAIRVWSGGNSSEQYAKFLMSRVPGLTRDTLINDAFLSSPSGIAFVKAQAQHEAGKVYPMTDAEWAEAQRKVFKTANPAPASTAVVIGGAAASAATWYAGNWHWIKDHWVGLLAGAIVLGIAVDVIIALIKNRKQNVEHN